MRYNNKNVLLPKIFVRPDEFRYTSSNGKKVIPKSDSLPPIVSNTYINGKGIIKCDRVITGIGFRAFYNCTNLKTITIPNSVTNLKT